MLPKTVSLKC